MASTVKNGIACLRKGNRRRWKKDPDCGWSHDHPESGWQKNLLGGRGGGVLCLVDVTNFVGFKSA